MDENLEVALAQTRHALSECEDRRYLAVTQADLVRREFGVQSKAPPR